MSARTWMPLYCADFIADTAHMGAAETGAYIALICHYWTTGKPLPDDDKRLARIARMTPDEWAETRLAMLEHFFSKDGAWRHARIDAELQEATRKYEKRASAGRKGGIAKAKPEQCQSNAKAGLYQPQPQPHDSEPSGSEVEPPRGDDLQAMVDDWNAMAADTGLPTVQKLTKARRAKALQRLRDAGGLEGWRVAVRRIRGSPFLTGANGRGWRADFDFALQESSFTKIMEGRYDDRPGQQSLAKPGCGEQYAGADEAILRRCGIDPGRAGGLDSEQRRAGASGGDDGAVVEGDFRSVRDPAARVG